MCGSDFWSIRQNGFGFPLGVRLKTGKPPMQLEAWLFAWPGWNYAAPTDLFRFASRNGTSQNREVCPNGGYQLSRKHWVEVMAWGRLGSYFRAKEQQPASVVRGPVW